MQYLSSAEVDRHLSIRDLSDPDQGHHAIQLVLQTAVDALQSLWDCEVLIYRGSRIVSLRDNYDDLGFGTDVVTRDRRYTKYVSESTILRSHATAGLMPALRSLSDRRLTDVLVLLPAMVYRRDSIDRLHTSTPHQLDLWRISTKKLDNKEMGEMIDVLVQSMLPNTNYRCEDRIHPYTNEGRQVDAHWNNEWVEIAECGLASPDVLARAGLEDCSGLAYGMGLDRMLMLRKQIPDIRLLRSNVERVECQMHDLNLYRPISSMPSISRDISVAVDVHDADEDLGDRVRNSLGIDADLVESVTLLSETRYEDLPEVARSRLGIARNQKNVLVRVVLQALDQTLSDAQANVLRNRVYQALHQGSESLLA